MSGGTPTFFITGGTLTQDTPSYVERRADTELYEGLRNGEFCYVLTARQMGKSSLMVRTANRLREEGFTVVTLDLTVVGQNLSIDQWYYGLLNLVGRELGIRAALREFWGQHADLGPLQRFMLAVEQVALRSEGTDPAEGPRLVIFVDEIDSVLSLPFNTDELFAAIRQCYNRRAESPALTRLTFCLLGVASPSDLIRDPRMTPFNIGRRVELHDFQEHEAAPLAVGLQLGAPVQPLRSRGVALRLLKRVLHWTNGHPYLTQRLCQEVAEDPKAHSARGVDAVCRRLFLAPGARSRDDNLLFVQQRLVKRKDDELPAYLDLYRRVRSRQPIPSIETNPLVPELRLCGIVRELHGRLLVRNLIYHQVFDRAWIEARMPGASLQREKAAYSRGLLRAGALGLTVTSATIFLSFTAIIQTRRSERLLAEMQLDRGVRRMQGGEDLGLLDIADSHHTAQHLPELQRSIAAIWASWHSVIRDRLISMVGHDTSATAVEFSPNGRMLATASMNGEVRIWSTDTWHEISVPIQHPERVLSLCFNRNSSLLLIHGRRHVELRGIKNGKCVAKLALPRGLCSFATFRPDGEQIAAAGSRGIFLWDRISGWRSRSHLPTRGALSLAYSPDGHFIVAGTLSGIETWDVLRQKRIDITQCDSPTERIRFAPDGHSIVTLSGEVTALRPFPHRESRLVQIPASHTQDFHFLSGPNPLLIVHEPNAIRLQSWPTNRDIGLPFLAPGTFHQLSVHPSKGMIAGARSDGSVPIWHISKKRGPTHQTTGKLPLIALSSNDSDTTRMITSDGKLTSWKPKFPTDKTASYRLAPSLDGACFDGPGTIIAGWKGAEFSIWHSATGHRILGPIRTKADIQQLFLSNSGEDLVVMAGDGFARIYSTQTGNYEQVRGGFPTNRRSIVAGSLNGAYLAAAGKRSIYVWGTHPNTSRDVPPPGPGEVRALSLSPSGDSFALALENQAYLIDSDTLQFKCEPLICSEPITKLAISSDHHTVAVGTFGNVVRLWNTRVGAELGQPLQLNAPAQNLLFVRNGTVLITAAANTLQLWDVESGKPLGVPLLHSNLISSLEWRSKTNTVVTTAGNDAYLWDVSLHTGDERLIPERTWAALGAKTNAQLGLERLSWVQFRRLREHLARSTTSKANPTDQKQTADL